MQVTIYGGSCGARARSALKSSIARLGASAKLGPRLEDAVHAGGQLVHAFEVEQLQLAFDAVGDDDALVVAHGAFGCALNALQNLSWAIGEVLSDALIDERAERGRLERICPNPRGSAAALPARL